MLARVLVEVKLRLIGAPDLVRAWAKKLEALGIYGKEYPSHRGTDLRWYADVDDRVADAAGQPDIRVTVRQADRPAGQTISRTDDRPVAVKRLPRRKKSPP